LQELNQYNVPALATPTNPFNVITLVFAYPDTVVDNEIVDGEGITPLAENTIISPGMGKLGSRLIPLPHQSASNGGEGQTDKS
jgi:hypothetical protein